MNIVSDSSALISLLDCGEIAILGIAFTEVIIPEEVENEVFKRPRRLRQKPKFIKIRSITAYETLAMFNRLRGQLDPGEAAAISLARQLDLDVIMDEAIGQSVCASEGVGFRSLPDVVRSLRDSNTISSKRFAAIRERLLPFGVYC